MDDDDEWTEKRASGKKKKVDHGELVKEKKSASTPRRPKANALTRTPATPSATVSSGPSGTRVFSQGTPPTTPSLKIRLPRLSAVLPSNTTSSPQPPMANTLHTPRSNGRQRLTSATTSSVDVAHSSLDLSKLVSSKFPNLAS